MELDLIMNLAEIFDNSKIGKQEKALSSQVKMKPLIEKLDSMQLRRVGYLIRKNLRLYKSRSGKMLPCEKASPVFDYFKTYLSDPEAAQKMRTDANDESVRWWVLDDIREFIEIFPEKWLRGDCFNCADMYCWQLVMEVLGYRDPYFCEDPEIDWIAAEKNDIRRDYNEVT